MLIYTDDYSEYDKNDLKAEVIEYNEHKKEDDITDDDIYEQFLLDDELWADDLSFDLKEIDKNIDGTIIAIADLGLWDGRRMAYKEIKNLPDICSVFEDINTLEIDRYNNLTLAAAHHDGTNYITFREIKPELSDWQVNQFEDKIYYGKATKKDITRYTRSIGKAFREYYGC